MNKIRKLHKTFFRIDEAIESAKPTQVFTNVNSYVSEQQVKKPLDDFSIRQRRDWGNIAHQVVGAEV